MTREHQIGPQSRLGGGSVGIALLCLALAGCSGSNKLGSTIDPRYGVSASPRVVADGEAVPKGGGAYRVGKPYKIAGKTYVPKEDPNYVGEGVASWYGDDFHGRLTANGEVFDRASISAAHPTLPMPSYVRVTNVRNNRSIIVRVNDRGPYHSNRIIDVSHATADLLGFKSNGIAKVRVEYVGRAPLDGSDDRKLAATLRDDGPAQVPSNSAIMVASATPFVPSLARVMPPKSDDGEIPFPLQRPYDLGHQETEPVSSSAEPVRQAANIETAPIQQAAAEPAPAPRQGTQTAFQAVRPAAQPGSTVVASGWAVGAQPVSGLGYAGVPTYASGR